MAIRSNYKTLRAQLEARLGDRVTYKDVVQFVNSRAKSKEDTISEPTLIRWANDSLNSVSYKTLEGVALFFQAHGIDVEPGDLLIYEPDCVAA